ncbi:hypothetical protein [Aporhodopirellula aestuarii]|uniref:Uncharacterized protein n=1 Tax=Aporhodopirellula aestuarii TaxID=2950107 RepID=A0ABT0U5C9_9BACT|nr:hypothetical protein [Aporhodopirellula aestuarii]MCM2372119.1 hypothetical protein [Aporhodopirellula aestuarii]
MKRSDISDFHWQTEATAAQLVAELVDRVSSNMPFATELAARMLAETGTRFLDWVDNIGIADDTQLVQRLVDAGFTSETIGGESCWQHTGGLFPAIRLGTKTINHLAIKVESVCDFLIAHQINSMIEGDPLAAVRLAKVASHPLSELWVIERHGNQGFEAPAVSANEVLSVLKHQEAFGRRRRCFDDALEGFEHAGRLVAESIEALGVDRTCDLFFAAERRYWQSRNRAARVQKQRQDRLGLGWANHDHHTYRSSREYFVSLIRFLESLGFVCRERFYGGAEAGWGAQVLEQSATGVIIFADVDLTPEEVTGDFAHDGLSPQQQLGTVGLWCKLHGEAFLQAGMHHLECQFDFDAAREQLAGEGIETMTPFTDFEYLKQAFTEGERWTVDSTRIERAVADGNITVSQADKFRSNGSIGSHLEILERNQGYKGFNQTGISEIIRQTDPRAAST